MNRFLIIALMLLWASSLILGQATAINKEQGKTASTNQRTPIGWRARGPNPQDYEMGLDTKVYHGGKASGYIKSKSSATPDTYATLMQPMKADNYRGQRVRLSGYIKGNRIEGTAQLWMRVEGEQRTLLSFDNMNNRPLEGTTDWKRYEIVLDVPKNSASIAFGLLLGGKGQVWIDDLELKAVGQDIALTNMEDEVKADPEEMEKERSADKEGFERKLESWRRALQTALSEPQNLDFEAS
jgi:hypothetical protein